MISIIPFLPSFYYGLQAYNAATEKAPDLQTSTGYRISPGTDLYNSALNQNDGSRLKDRLYPYLQESPNYSPLSLEKIREDLIIIVQPNSGLAYAVGTNYFMNGAAIISIDSEAYRTHSEACDWLAIHELAHIRNNDHFKIPLVAAISSAAAAIFSFSKMTTTHSALFALAVGTAAAVSFTYYREGKADDEANELASADTLRAAKKYLESELQKNIKSREKGTLHKFLLSSSGECRLDVWHPSLASRIKKIEIKLQQQ